MKPEVRSFLHAPSSTWTHVACDPATGKAAVIDPVRDYDPDSGRTGTASADSAIAYVVEAGLAVEWILETHAHADHISAAPYVQSKLGGRIAIGSGITGVQRAFRDIYCLGEDFPVDGSQFDHLFDEGERFKVGGIEAEVIATPGHTSDGLSYLVGDAVFVGDTLFMPDSGTARCDFPGGDAALLHASIQKLFALPPGTRMFLCHDYGADDREAACETTVAEQRASNIHVGGGRGVDDFVRLRTERDATLDMPVLLLPALQVNIRAGHFPPPEANGVRYLRIPVDRM